MSCRKCGYRFLWELKEGVDVNKCPVCLKRRGWRDDAEPSATAVEARRWYWRRKTRPDEVRHPERLDVVSTSTDIAAGAGEPQIYRVSASFKLPQAPDTVSSGWRPWSRIATTPVASPALGLGESVRATFDRTYSRQYTRLYAMPYNNNEKPALYSYPTSYAGRKDARHFTTPGSAREVVEREGRDYKSLLDSSYRVKSYNRKVVHLGQ